MNEFIQLATSKLGTHEDIARSATGSLLGFIQGQLGKNDFSQLIEKLPGASDLLEQSSAKARAASGLGGMLGDLAGQVASAVGSDLGAATGLVAQLEESGLELDQAGSFVTLFIDFVRGKLGSGFVDGILQELPELNKLPS